MEGSLAGVVKDIDPVEYFEGEMKTLNRCAALIHTHNGFCETAPIAKRLKSVREAT